MAYYALSYDYAGDYYKKNPSKSPGKKMEISKMYKQAKRTSFHRTSCRSAKKTLWSP